MFLKKIHKGIRMRCAIGLLLVLMTFQLSGWKGIRQGTDITALKSLEARGMIEKDTRCPGSVSRFYVKNFLINDMRKYKKQTSGVIDKKRILESADSSLIGLKQVQQVLLESASSNKYRTYNYSVAISWHLF